MMVARGYLHISDGDFLALSVCSIYSLNLISIYGSSAKYVYYIMFFSLHLCSLLSATTDQVTKAKDVIKKLTIGFDSSQFENPCKISHFV